jgi:biopolymer transport protein ExbD
MISKSKAVAILKRRKSEEIKASHDPLDTSAIGDIAFLLLIFFIVTSSFLLRQGLLFALPSKTASAQIVSEKSLLLVSPIEKKFEFRKHLYTEGNLKKALAAESKKIDEPIIIIVMNGDTAFEGFIKVLSIAQELKIGKVSIRRKN